MEASLQLRDGQLIFTDFKHLQNARINIPHSLQTLQFPRAWHGRRLKGKHLVAKLQPTRSGWAQPKKATWVCPNTRVRNQRPWLPKLSCGTWNVTSLVGQEPELMCEVGDTNQIQLGSPQYVPIPIPWALELVSWGQTGPCSILKSAQVRGCPRPRIRSWLSFVPMHRKEKKEFRVPSLLNAHMGRIL